MTTSAGGRPCDGGAASLLVATNSPTTTKRATRDRPVFASCPDRRDVIPAAAAAADRRRWQQQQQRETVTRRHFEQRKRSKQRAFFTDNDPSAGSPTETLLRLLLPLNDRVRSSSPGIERRGEYDTRVKRQRRPPPLRHVHAARRRRRPDPRTSPDRSIGSSDGRCVQRAGT